MILELTKASVESIVAPDPSGKQVIYWDTKLKGFGVLISGITNTKTYIAQGYIPGDKNRRLTVGRVDKFENVEDARRNADSILFWLREGAEAHPNGMERRYRPPGNVRSLRFWLVAYLTVRRDLRYRTIREYRRSITCYLAAWLDLPIHNITREMVDERRRNIVTEVTAPGRSGSDGQATANTVMAALRAVYNYASYHDETLPQNPVLTKKDRFDEVPHKGMSRKRHSQHSKQSPSDGIITRRLMERVNLRALRELGLNIEPGDLE